MSVSPYRFNLTGAEGYHRAPLALVPNLPLPSAIEVSAPNGIWLTDDVFFHFQRCQRRAFLDVHGDRSQRDAPSDYLLKLRQDSLAHQALILAEQPAHKPEYPHRDWLAGAKATEALMQQGVDRITGSVLQITLEAGVQLVSSPNLLIKQSGASRWGDWMYVPVDVRLGKRPKLDYQMASAFHAYVLAAVQGVWPETSWLILRQRGAYAVDLMEMVPRMQEILHDCAQTILQPAEPEVFIAHNRCDLCHWYSHCYGIAQESIHLSLLPGVTPSRYVYLKDLDITTLERLANAHPKQLEPLPGFGLQVAHRLIQQARATLHNRAIPHVRPTDTPIYPLLTANELPTHPIELYFDIEAAPDPSVVYLHGVLVVDRATQTETFHPLLAQDQDDEQRIWEELLALFWRYPQAPIFHFCPYEVQTVKRLAEQYGTPYQFVEPLMSRFVDLHERVTRIAILPVESYALKPIARWIGFDWRDSDANGAQSICWYAQWQETGDQAALDAILRYNEDDCRATYRIKDWLVEFCQPEAPPESP